VTLYTRTGDGGETSLLGGARVSKADARVEAYGDVDELNAWIGFCRAATSGTLDPDLDTYLADVQRDLFALGAQLADPEHRVTGRAAKTGLGDEDVNRLELIIDKLDAEAPPLRRFILAGGVPGGAALHVARAVCRRAERRIVSLQPAVEAVLVRYVNRLSDMLFVLARVVNYRAGRGETEW
jgi:cob(I)alamin adenosyltransferase